MGCTSLAFHGLYAFFEKRRIKGQAQEQVCKLGSVCQALPSNYSYFVDG